MTKSSMCHFRTRWDFINPLATEPHTTNGISMLTSIHLYCARRRFANSWLDSNCWAMRNATSLQKSRHSGCAKSCRPDWIDQSMRDVRVCMPYPESLKSNLLPGVKHGALSQYFVSRVFSYGLCSRGSNAFVCAITSLERGEG